MDIKISRSDVSLCGSRKKIKKCCLNRSSLKPSFSQNYFNLKGKRAEEIVHALAEKTFLTDWCYKNPKLPNGKELCDLLVVFDDVAIIWQIKDLKLDEHGRYKKAEVDKNLRQLSGARRRLFELKAPITLSNPRRGREMFNPNQIKEVYLISALMGKGEDYFIFVEELKNLIIHVFNRKFTQIILNELDTISDFVDYLREKEVLVRTGKKIVLLGGEEELLAFYLMNNRSFGRFKDATMIIIDEGSWSHLQHKPEYKAKKELDKISYGWDEIINRAHEGSLEYEKVARELARPNRFERRYLSKAFFDAFMQAHNDNQHDLFRRICPNKGITYCFLFMDDPEPREKRKSMLFAICWVARDIFPQNKKVLGIATEKKIRPQCSYDFCLLDKPRWTKKDKKRALQLQKEAGIFLRPQVSRIHEDEYPQLKDNQG